MGGSSFPALHPLSVGIALLQLRRCFGRTQRRQDISLRHRWLRESQHWRLDFHSFLRDRERRRNARERGRYLFVRLIDLPVLEHPERSKAHRHRRRRSDAALSPCEQRIDVLPVRLEPAGPHACILVRGRESMGSLSCSA